MQKTLDPLPGEKRDSSLHHPL